MKLARVVGNVVSTIKERTHENKKLLIVDYVDQNGKVCGSPQVALDAVEAGVGDLVLVSHEGGGAKMLLNDKELVSNCVICGIVDYYTFDGVDYAK